ncbi:MAG: substrate-binding domain-containing protein [Desulfoprunum sp.]|jgi:tungstate transport system substrate-binding protein|nr:tungsten ABC transporter substrate-binding protein [Desulfobulbus sp. Tol-SR]
MKRLSWVVIGAFLLVSASIGGAMAEDKVLTMSTTTSTESSGLLDVLLPEFKKDTGIEVKVLAKGTGAALKDGMDGNVDVVFVHAKKKEAEFVEKGFGTQRYAVMHNDFIIVGPPADPAGIKGSKDSIEALEKIAAAKAPFISRGDDSGTHTKEQEIWAKTSLKLEETSQKLVISGKEAQVVAKKPENSDVWYYSIGQGMGKTLTFADEKNAYAIADRGTYIAYKWGKTPAVDLEILFEGDETLANPYGVIPVNPKKFPHVKYDLAQQFADWLMSARGQKVIADFKLEGKQLFFPDAIK